jgi:hypothetical protein
MTNGFFEDQLGFIRRLKPLGNINLITSLDSYSEEKTDANRGRPGVFRKVKSLAELCKCEDFPLHILAHNVDGWQGTEKEKVTRDFFGITEMEPIRQLGNAIRYGLGPRAELFRNKIGDLSPSERPQTGWCKGFTRPSTLHIRPTGNVGNCLYAYAIPEEFGNLHASSMESIINGIQNTRVYQMFKDGRIERYQHELDQSIFTGPFSSSCEIVVLTLAYGVIKEQMVKQGVADPVKMANQKVAELYKFNNPAA